jgi:hypothetical protein
MRAGSAGRVAGMLMPVRYATGGSDRCAEDPSCMSGDGGVAAECPGSARAGPRLRFEVSFPAAAHAQAITGRAFVLKA